jgi:hypothetical protein
MQKKMSELVTGDIVTVQLGLRVRVEELKSRELTASYDEDIREGLISEGHKPYVYWTVGTVVNATEAIANGFPRGYLTAKDGQFFWTVAGNDRRVVNVED